MLGRIVNFLFFSYPYSLYKWDDDDDFNCEIVLIVIKKSMFQVINMSKLQN